MHKPKVLIVMGSQSDLPVMQEAEKALAELGITAEMSIVSAHRTPARAQALAKEAAGRGVKVIIAGAGMAAHLAGAMAAHTTLPVIGVPLEGSSVGGLDALLSTVQMPSGVPVATVSIGKPGAKNAAILATEILALSRPDLRQRLRDYKEALERSVEEKDREMVAGPSDPGGAPEEKPGT